MTGADWNVLTPSGFEASHRRSRLIADVRAGCELAWQLFQRDLKAQYRQSLLGYLWAFVPPVLVAVSFTLAGKASILNVTDIGIPYPVFALIGTALWQSFGEAITCPLAAVTASKPLLARIRFPSEAVVLAKFGDVLFNFALKLVLIAAVLAIYQVPVGWGVLLAPFGVFALVCFGAALGLFLAPIGGLYEDVGRGLPMLLGIGLFLTPVVYSRAAPGSVIDWINTLNPVTPLLVTTRELLTTGMLSQPREFLIVAGMTPPLLLLGWLFYRFGIRFSIERSSA